MTRALLVIDAQRVYTDPDGSMHCADSSTTLANINRLISAAQAAGTPVILVRHLHQADGSDLGRMFDYAGDDSGEFNFKAGTEEVEFSPELHRPPRAIEIVKNRYSAFQGTELHTILQKLHVQTVVICGFMSNFCCDATAKEAHDRDYFVDFIVDATGTPGTDALDQDQIRKIEGELLAAGFARVSSTTDYIRQLQDHT